MTTYRELLPISANSRWEAAAANLLSLHSWGCDYPIDPLVELQKAVYKVAAFDGHGLVGFAVVNRHADPRPNTPENDELWFSCWVVHPDYRRRGIGRALHDHCIRFMQNTDGKFRLSGENQPMIEWLKKQGWIVIDDPTINKFGTCVNEAGEATTIMEFDL